MAKKNNGNKVWIMGAVLGAVAGAAYALWKTPMSGQDLRTRLSPGPVDQSDAVNTDKVHTPNAADRMMSKVEQTLAPIVGVQLGKTANGPAPTNESVTAPISVPPAPASPVAEPVVVSSPPEDTVMTKPEKNETEMDPKFNAADATADPASNAKDVGDGGIRAKRFAWGSPTPEAGVQPVPAEPMEEDPVTEPAMAREPATPAQVVPPGDSAYGSDTLRSRRFSWGDPAPESTNGNEESTDGDTAANQPVTDQLATAGATTAGENRPLEAVSSEAAGVHSQKRQFPKLGGLENVN